MSTLTNCLYLLRLQMGKSTQIDRSATCGRIICDTLISAREVIRAKSYDLSELVTQILKQKREEVDMEQMKASYRSEFVQAVKGVFN